MLERIAELRTDLVFDYLAEGHPPSSKAGRNPRYRQDYPQLRRD